MKELTFDINNMAKKQLTLTITMKGFREFKIRCWLAMRLIGLLSLIAPFNVKVITEQGEEGASSLPSQEQ